MLADVIEDNPCLGSELIIESSFTVAIAYLARFGPFAIMATRSTRRWCLQPFKKLLVLLGRPGCRRLCFHDDPYQLRVGHLV